ncbi:GumC family protein [Notoacmeibacter marinus]|uniref:GumC family protein n=1 Tax=Notoacmeibacter marinus TaxID=1876515 RepID=UPI0013B06484|nr:GumC family protein [Notoacmeibacter marinus]
MSAELKSQPRSEAPTRAARPNPAVNARQRPVEKPVEATPTVLDSVRHWMAAKKLEPAGEETPRVDRQNAPVAEPSETAPSIRPAADREVHREHSSFVPERRRVQSEVWRPAVDPLAVLTGIWNAKLIVVATTLIGAILGVVIALSTPKLYVASADVLIDPRDIKISDRDLTSQGLPSDATLALVENQVRLMYAPQVMRKVASDLDLANDPRFTAPPSGLFALIEALRSLVSLGSDGDDDSEIANAASDLAQSLEIARADRTFVVSVAAETRDPQLSADIANAVIDAYVDVSRNLSSATAGRAESEITARLDDLRTEVEAAERAVEAFRTENDLVESQGRLITDEEILRLNDQLANAEAQLIELQAKARSIRETSTDAILGGGLPEAINSPVIGELRAQYAQLRQQAESLSARLGPRHPQRIAIESQLRGSREQMAAELRRIAASAEAELRRARQQQQDLSDRLAQLKVRQGDISDELVTLRQLEREAAAKRNIYESYLLRARDAGEQKDIDTTNISIIGKAQPPLRPEGPSRSSTVILSTILGFLAGVVIGAVRGVWADMTTQRSLTGSKVFIRDRRNTEPESENESQVQSRDEPEETPSEDSMYRSSPYPDAYPPRSTTQMTAATDPYAHHASPAMAPNTPPYEPGHHGPMAAHDPYGGPSYPSSAGGWNQQHGMRNEGYAPQTHNRPAYGAQPVAHTWQGSPDPYPYLEPAAAHYPAAPNWQGQPVPYDPRGVRMAGPYSQQQNIDQRELAEMRETVRSMRHILDDLASRISR